MKSSGYGKSSAQSTSSSATTEAADPELIAEAQAFADEVADLINRTVSEDPPIRAFALGGRVVVAPFNENRAPIPVPLTIGRAHRLDLRLRFDCIWDFTRRFLAIDTSEFALKLPGGEPLVRFDYLRSHSWSPAHIQLHAESSALGYLLAFKPRSEKAPKTQILHLPVGGTRFRPCLEDVIEFAIHDLGVKGKDGWQARVEEGRARFHHFQLLAALRDAIKNDPELLPEQLKKAIDDARRDVTGRGDRRG